MRELSEVIKEKKVAKTKILKQYNFPKNSRAVILNLISDENLKNFVTSACEEIGASVIESLENFDKNLLIGADAIVSEKIEKNSEFEEIFEQAVTPIFPSASHYDFEEFKETPFFFMKISHFKFLKKSAECSKILIMWATGGCLSKICSNFL